MRSLTGTVSSAAVKAAAQKSIAARLNPLFRVHDVRVVDGLPRGAWFVGTSAGNDVPFEIAALVLVSPLLAPRFRRNRKLLLVALYALVVIAGLAMAGGEVYPRYIVVLIPFLAVVGGVVLAGLAPWPPLAPSMIIK